ncbi:MAG: protein translocase subunit SecD [Deltaproteobacteria bacterium]|nr:protein translocase subunit SecD [Deltaproteobacteria bacterium]
MPGSWWAKSVLVGIALLLGIYVLLPTMLGGSAWQRLEEQAATVDGSAPTDEADAFLPWYASLLPDTYINRGLDLQGGIDLTLQVGVEEAVLSTVQRDIGPLQEAAEREGIRLEEVRRLSGEPALLIRPGEGITVGDLRQFMLQAYRSYEYEGTRMEAAGEYHVFRLSTESQDYIQERAVEQALETLRDRIDETGVKEPSIVRKGVTGINVQLPGMDNLDQAVEAIGTTAVLQFMMVDEDVKDGSIEKALLEAEKTLEPAVFLDDQRLSDWLVNSGRIPPSDRLLWEYSKGPDNKDVRTRALAVKDEIVLTGDDINDAHVAMNQFNEPYVALEFKPRGGRIFADVTGENVGKRFAIVLDDKMRSAPVIRERIAGGRASIEMGAGSYQDLLKDASVLSLVLRTGALPAPVTVGEVRTVGATLGADTIRAGVSAALVAAALVSAFILLVYRKVGVVAVSSLALNMLLLLAGMAVLGATLTLPGIAGIALTVGMAVDCNIIIYERIRDEVRAGKNIRAATESGFEKAYSAVLDANITTFIAGVVLYSYGTGPIRGFAVTLMVGILSTLFTGVFTTRVLMDLLTRKATARLAF